MTIPMLTTASTVQCLHGGTVSLSTSNADVKADGSPVLLVSDQHTVSGCPFTVPAGPSPKPQPCVSVKWTVGATQTKINGTAVLLKTSVGLCYSAEQIPQGPPVVANTQEKAKGI